MSNLIDPQKIVSPIPTIDIDIIPKIVEAITTDSQHEAIITFNEGGQRRIYAFVCRDHLKVYYWDGIEWHWADQGAPPNGPLHSAGMSVITFREGDKQRIYAFVADYAAGLVANVWDGSKWQWTVLGKPPGIISVWRPSVITYRQAGKQHIYAFTEGHDEGNSVHLCVYYWDGSQWRWTDQGQPPDTTFGSFGCLGPAVTCYDLESHQQSIYVFVEGANHQWYANYWDGSQWHWTKLGIPFAQFVGWVTAVTYQEASKQHIRVFVRDAQSQLYVCEYDGDGWHWADVGNPPASALYMDHGMSTTTYNDGHHQKVYTFVVGTPVVDNLEFPSARSLAVNYWDGSEWHWDDLGVVVVPPNEGSTHWNILGAVSFHELAQERIYAFVVQSDTLALSVNYWDGSNWHWMPLEWSPSHQVEKVPV